MSYLKIEEKNFDDIESFKFEEWRAIVLSKEKRMDKDYFFATMLRFYGKQDNTFEYDVGDSADEYATIGRTEKFVGHMGPDKDPDSKTFGKRIEFPPVTEVIEVINSSGKSQKKTVLVKGRSTFDFTLPVNKENIEKVKLLIGPISVDRGTSFQMVLGTENPVSVDQETFFKHTVDEIFAHHHKLKKLSDIKKETEKK